ncbi:hypothetical protein RRG08_011487 [Elysia crispata]|uniref:VWFC domain-containing protein n=1 Tax=Elysia crispata TaxID=231223 RepID=A0AAE1B961_9GAST|nr:hypothetical protein RRG08_011487 [Elysia crispata]
MSASQGPQAKAEERDSAVATMHWIASQQTGRQPVLLVTLLLTLASLVAARPTQERCQMENKTYGVGETWQIGPFCASCTCLEGGQIGCKAPTCPSIDCEEPRQTKGQCCPTCDNPPTSPFTTPDEELTSDLLLSSGCDYLDGHYEVGEAFASNRSGLKTNSDDQCVLCHCMESGEVLCVLQTCLPRPGCSRMVRVSEDCCPVCADELSSEGGDCAMPSGQRMRNGSSWQPTIEQIGVVACVTCTCLDGEISCERLDCPEDSALPCSDPRHQKGKCCKTCPGQQKALEIANRGRGKGEKGGKGSPSKKNKTKSQNSRPEKRKRKKKRKCRHLKDQEKKKCRKRLKKLKKRRRKSRKLSDMRLEAILGRLCLHDDTERLVYRSKGDNSESLYFDEHKENKIEQLHWVIRKGKIQRTDRKVILDPREVRRNVRVREILGTASAKDIKRFKRRLDRRQTRCTKKCRRKLLDKAVKKLKLRPLDLNKTCSGRSPNN